MPELGVLDDLNNSALPIDTSSQDNAASIAADPVLPKVDPAGYDPSSYDPASYDSVGYDATTKNLTSDQLVLNNLDKVLNKDGVLMDVARSAGDEYSNSRGMLNSSMGAQASMRSMIDSALPIASQDASSYLSQLQNNQMYENRASEFGATAENRASELNAAAENTAGQFRATAENTAGQFNAASQNEIERFNATNEVQQTRDSILQSYQLQMENLSTNNKALLIDLEQKYAAAIQSDRNASDAYMQAMDSVAQIMSAKDLSVDQQNAGMNETISMLEAYLDFNVNLNSVDSISGVTATAATTDTGTVTSDRGVLLETAANLAETTDQAKTTEYYYRLNELGERPVASPQQSYNSDYVGGWPSDFVSIADIAAWDEAKTALDTEYQQYLR